MRPGTRCRTWRQFGLRERRAIERQIAAGPAPTCPCCGDPLAARSRTRLLAVLPAGAGGLDLDCRACRQFHPRLRFDSNSRYALRIRRLAAAVLRV